MTNQLRHSRPEPPTRESYETILVAGPDVLLMASGCGSDGSPTDPDARHVGRSGSVRRGSRYGATQHHGLWWRQPNRHCCGDRGRVPRHPECQAFLLQRRRSESRERCTAPFVRGSQARIQRLVGLVNEDEGAWRLSGWGGDRSLDADTEPRGGLCTVTMDRDRTVTASFERRAKLSVEMVLQDFPMSIRWSLAFSPQKAGGNPTTRGGTFDCNSPSGLPVCTVEAYYDPGTSITVTAGSGAGQPAFWEGWVSGCFGASIGVYPHADWRCENHRGVGSPGFRRSAKTTLI